MDEISEQTENMRQIQEALATPIGSAADFDEVFNLYFNLLISLKICMVNFSIMVPPVLYNY